jgi:hypothetical protein
MSGGSAVAVAVLGGGSGAVGTSAHAACQRYRGTDPLVTGLTRRRLAAELKFPDVAGGIPQARWTRAMTFERLVRDERFASQVATTTLGQLDLARPPAVVIADADGDMDRTATLVADAHARAIDDGSATVIHDLSVPFIGHEDADATDVRPDFVVVGPKAPHEGGGTWVIVGDAKDYERVRSRVEDGRLLKGFLQVAVGAESLAAWSLVPDGMDVHRWGVLAVPKNSFLQPEAVVEDLTDHRSEIAMRVEERLAEAAAYPFDPITTPIDEFVGHLRATYDPVSCSSCTLFGYCRDELERSTDPTDLLIELGVPVEVRPRVVGLVDGTGESGTAPSSVAAMIAATQTGRPVDTGQRRIDPVGLAGTVDVVVAKSDAAALGLHGIATRRVTAAGPTEWSYVHFDEPQSSSTRLSVMKVLGKEISSAMADARRSNADAPDPVHVVVPDKITADVLASIADNLAGVELSRLRWQRDIDEGRPALTFDGEPASVPAPLSETARTAVSFLLEEDRARALTLRAPVVDLRATLARHVVAGGPSVNSGRLDYLVGWADADDPIDHRVFGKEIERSPHTPGARLANGTSDEIHKALTGHRGKGDADQVRYASLVRDELEYKTAVFERAVAALAEIETSNLRDAYRSIEGDAQAVWRRRLSLHASDLVRFGRVYRTWRNGLVETIEKDDRCASQLLALTNPQEAFDRAVDAGNRELVFATVVEATPEIVLEVNSRRLVDGDRVVLLHVNDRNCAEGPAVEVKTSQKGAFKISGLSIGPLEAVDPDDPARRATFAWLPSRPPLVAVGDRLIVADFAWFSTLKGNKDLSVDKPTPDDQQAPKPETNKSDGCGPSSYDADPEGHKFCCKSHEHNEAEWSDELAARRSRGEMNPQAWPPVRNADGFDVAAKGSPVGDPFDGPGEDAPDGLTIDDVE